MDNRTGKRITKELRILMFILFFGFLFAIDPTGVKNFNYPLAMRPEWQHRFNILGKALIYGGYPLSVLIRVTVWLFRRK